MEQITLRIALILLVGSIFGQILHVMAEKLRELRSGTESEFGIFRRWVVARPFSTLISAVGALIANMAMVNMEASLVYMLIQAAGWGVVGNAMLNSAGEPDR